jgi:hypothetical protein
MKRKRDDHSSSSEEHADCIDADGWGGWSMSRRRRNYCTVGLNLREVLSEEIFSDGILAMVLDYCGLLKVYVLSWSSESDNDHDYVKAEHEVVGAYETRTQAAFAALNHMDLELHNYRKKGKTKAVQLVLALKKNDDPEQFVQQLSAEDQELLFDEISDDVQDRRGTMHAPEPLYEIHSFVL